MFSLTNGLQESASGAAASEFKGQWASPTTGTGTSSFGVAQPATGNQGFGQATASGATATGGPVQGVSPTTDTGINVAGVSDLQGETGGEQGATCDGKQHHRGDWGEIGAILLVSKGFGCDKRRSWKKLSNLTFAQQIVEICFSLTNRLQGRASGSAASGCPGQWASPTTGTGISGFWRRSTGNGQSRFWSSHCIGGNGNWRPGSRGKPDNGHGNQCGGGTGQCGRPSLFPHHRAASGGGATRWTKHVWLSGGAKTAQQSTAYAASGTIIPVKTLVKSKRVMGFGILGHGRQDIGYT